MNNLIFMITAFLMIGICSCKKDIPKPVPKHASLGTLEPIMDPPGHLYTPCDISPNTHTAKLLKNE